MGDQNRGENITSQNKNVIICSKLKKQPYLSVLLED